MLAISLAGFFKSIILLGIVQGVVVMVLLLCARSNRQANHLLAALIFLITLACFTQYCDYVNWFDSPRLRVIAYFIPLVVIMPIGPLIYFYVQAWLDPAFVVTAKRRRHFYAVLVDLVPALTTIVFTLGVITKTIKNNPAPWGSFLDNYNVYSDIPRWLSLSFYLFLSAKHLSAHKASLPGAGREVQWLQQLIYALLGFQVVWLVYLVPYTIPAYTDIVLQTFNWYPIYIPLAVLVYWMGTKGYVMSLQRPVPKKAAATLTTDALLPLVERLTHAMEIDKLYRNPDLNLSVLSQQLSIAPKLISAVLNQHLLKSFNEFVNEYRVRECQEKIKLPAYRHLTLAGIARECGFNSQATFQRTFKEVTGVSPSAFKKTMAAL